MFFFSPEHGPREQLGLWREGECHDIWKRQFGRHGCNTLWDSVESFGARDKTRHGSRSMGMGRLWEGVLQVLWSRHPRVIGRIDRNHGRLHRIAY